MNQKTSILPALRVMLMEKNTGILKQSDKQAQLTLTDPENLDGIKAQIEAYETQNGKKPQTVSVCGATYEVVNAYDESKRLSEKIGIVTGSAQGFGQGIAYEMVKQGAYVVIADLNDTLAEKVASDLCAEFGAGRAISLKVDVSDEASVQNMIDTTVETFGGLDIFVNNAGVVKSGSLEEMDLKSFEFVTKINYIAYFLCTKYAVGPMKLQTKYKEGYYCDVIQINSKSGLTGSNKNFAYAGSKFGGIGLTQSFALELTPYNIKVNSICPGNFLDGPLWKDPVNGLYVQYFKAGKVPGAKSIEDVEKYYKAKVPMNRGCECIDVARALFYIVEQQYETGQAVPVTGGQAMLN